MNEDNKKSPDMVTVPVVPDEALLISMALRFDHGFFLLPPAHRKVIIDDMRKVHEEVVGTGFYKPENRDRYLAMRIEEDKNAEE